MSNWKLSLITAFVGLSVSVNAEAQILKKLGKQLEEKASQMVDQAINKPLQNNKAAQAEKNSTGASGPFKNVAYLPNDFALGSQILFADDFSNNTIGSMAKKWSSNGNGSVTTVKGVDGHWLKLYDDNTYKLKDLLNLPERFTLSFDLLTYGEGKNDFEVDFGFDYQKGVGAHYYLPNRNPLNIKASYRFNRFEFNSKEVNPSRSSEVQANMSYFVNDVMKVKMRVDGKNMVVFVNDYKVLDADMVDPKSKKYLYLAVDNDKNLNQIYLGNVKITKL